MTQEYEVRTHEERQRKQIRKVLSTFARSAGTVKGSGFNVRIETKPRHVFKLYVWLDDEIE